MCSKMNGSFGLDSLSYIHGIEPLKVSKLKWIMNLTGMRMIKGKWLSKNLEVWAYEL